VAGVAGVAGVAPMLASSVIIDCVDVAGEVDCIEAGSCAPAVALLLCAKASGAASAAVMADNKIIE